MTVEISCAAGFNMCEASTFFAATSIFEIIRNSLVLLIVIFRGLSLHLVAKPLYLAVKIHVHLNIGIIKNKTLEEALCSFFLSFPSVLYDLEHVKSLEN